MNWNSEKDNYRNQKKLPKIL